MLDKQADTETAPSDAELVFQASAGDTDSFASLLERHRRMVSSVAARVIADRAAVEDLVQEASLIAFHSLKDLHDPGRFGAWFCGIALNLCRGHLRRLHSDESLDTAGASDIGTHQSGPQSDPASIFEEKELRTRVLAAVNELPSATRSATLLFYYRQMSVREIAASLGISVGAVKVRLNRARQRLRQELAEPIPEPVAFEKRRVAMVKVYVADVVESQFGEESQQDATPNHIVVLVDESRKRALLIWVDRASGKTIALNARSVESRRPRTFEFIGSLLGAADASVKEVRVERLEDDTFYAVVVVSGPSGTKEIDARPSDAIALASHLGSPMFVSDEVMKQAGIDVPSSGRPESAGGRGLDALVSEMEQQFQRPHGIACVSEEEKAEAYQKLAESVFGVEQ